MTRRVGGRFPLHVRGMVCPASASLVLPSLAVLVWRSTC
jgi:hypothetical protein